MPHGARLVVSLLHHLAYLQGYKAAVFDSHYRFRKPREASAKAWKHEDRACQELNASLASMLDQANDATDTQVSSLLEQYLRNKREKFGLESAEYDGARTIVERALAFLSDPGRARDEGSRSPAIRLGPWVGEKRRAAR